MRKLCALFVASTFLWAGTCRAEMAVAIGTTGNVSKDGFVWGGGFGSNARQVALDVCRGVAAPEVGELPPNTPRVRRLCKIVTDFSDKCFAIAQDGNTRSSGTGFGWAVEADLKSAEAAALDKCDEVIARGRTCKIEYSHCDGAD
jgi:uncharacterized protein DUF4189